MIVSVAVYIDESGTHDPTWEMRGATEAAVGGYVGWKEDWEDFIVQWGTVLHRYGPRVFHFSDFANKRNRSNDPEWAYFGWTDSHRKAFLEDLAGVINEYVQFPVGGVSSGRNVRERERILGRNLGKPLWVAAAKFFENLNDEIGQRWRDYKNETIHFIYDRGGPDDLTNGMTFLYNDYKANSRMGPLMGPLTRDSKESSVPIQAADMFVYTLRQRYEKRARNVIFPITTRFQSLLNPGMNDYSRRYPKGRIVRPW